MSDDLTIAYMMGVEDMRSRLHKQADEIERLRAENERLREALKAERERCAKIAERFLSNNEPVRLTANSIAAAIRESGDE